MKRTCLWLLFVLGTGASAVAAPVISANDYYLLPGQGVTVEVTISGLPTDVAEGLDLYLQIGSGGPANGGLDEGPQFSGDLDVIGLGTVFSGNNIGVSTESLGSRIRSASTVTASGTVPAQGVLGRIDVTTTPADVGSWSLKLSGVAASLFTPDGLATGLGDEGNPPTLIDGNLYVWDLHPLTWSKGANGTWGELGSWTADELPAHTPNVTTNAVIDTPHNVSLNGVGQTNALTVSAGQFTLGATGSLTAPAGVTVQGSGVMTIADGAVLAVPSLSVLTGGQVNAGTLTNVALVVNGGVVDCTALDATAGFTGGVTVGGAAGSLLQTSYIRQDSLTITANGVVEIKPSVVVPGGSPLGSSVSAVPEPGSLVLLALAALAGLLWRRR